MNEKKNLLLFRCELTRLGLLVCNCLLMLPLRVRLVLPLASAYIYRNPLALNFVRFASQNFIRQRGEAFVCSRREVSVAVAIFGFAFPAAARRRHARTAQIFKNN
ncbi:hypothetical protein [Methanimicrococcus hongohii]|uniref:hypothetical protein n=1 Tax=Methanimicrococcus hongohii TaxID=3028295 RepID=UPI0029307C5E|nr:hypothetical protein [Methanimicrococcus sp. Hf6]